MTEHEVIARELEHNRCRSVRAHIKPIRRLQLTCGAALVVIGDTPWLDDRDHVARAGQMGEGRDG